MCIRDRSDGDFKPPSINIERDIDEVKPPSDVTSVPKDVSPMQLCHKMDSLSLKKNEVRCHNDVSSKDTSSRANLKSIGDKTSRVRA